MHRAIRSQADEPETFEAYSLATATDFDPDDDRARQEFAADADVNTVLGRFGVGGLAQRQASYGSIQDFDLDLQTAMSAVEDAQRAHRKLPRELREKYPTWQALLNGLYTGTLQLDLKEGPPPAEKPDSGQPKAADPPPPPAETPTA